MTKSITTMHTHTYIPAIYTYAYCNGKQLNAVNLLARGSYVRYVKEHVCNYNAQ